MPVLDPIEEAAQRLNIKTAVAEVRQSLSDGVGGHDGKTAVERRAGGYDAQIMVEHDEGLANRIDDAVGIGAGRLDLLLHRLHLGNIGEGDDHAAYIVVLRAIGEEAPAIPSAAIGLDLVPQRYAGGDDRLCVHNQIVIDEAACDLRQGSAEIGGRHFELRRCGRREESKPEIAIEKECRDAGTVEDALGTFAAVRPIRFVGAAVLAIAFVGGG